MAALDQLALPEGFVLDQPERASVPPSGFQLDTPQPATVRLPLAFYIGAADHPVWKSIFPNLPGDETLRQLDQDYAKGTVPEAIARGLGTAAADMPMLLASGSAVEAVGLGRVAAEALPRILTSRVSWLPYYAQRVVNSGATFGLKQLAESTVEGIAQGHLDPAEMASEVGRETAFGGALGVIGAAPTKLQRVLRGVMGGAGIAAVQGGGPAEMASNAVIFGAFELIHGETTMSRKVEALRSAENATAEYLVARDNITHEQAVKQFRQALAGDLLKAGVPATDEALAEAISTTPAKRLEEAAARIRGLTPEPGISTEPPLPATPALAQTPVASEAPVVPQAQPGAQAAAPAVAMPPAERTERIFRLGGPAAMTKFGTAGKLSDEDVRRLTETVNPPSEISPGSVEPSAVQAQISPSLPSQKPGEISPAAKATGTPGDLDAIHTHMDEIEQQLPTLVKQGGQGDQIRALKQEHASLEDQALSLVIAQSAKAKERGAPLVEGRAPIDKLVPDAGFYYPTAPVVLRKVKIARSIVVLLPDDTEAATHAVEAISAGQAGRRARTEAGDWIGIPSSFPSYFKNKGYTKKASVTILTNLLEGKPVTDQQKAIALDIIAGARASLQAEEASYGARGDQLQTQAGVAGAGQADIEEATRSAQAAAQSEVAAAGLGEQALEEGPLPEGATEFLTEEPPATPSAPSGPTHGEAGGYADIPLEAEGGGEVEIPTVRFGGMEEIHPLEMPELVRLHREISPTGAVPGLKKFPRMLGRSPYPGGQAKVHPWLFLDQKAVDALRAEIGKYVDPDDPTMNNSGTPPPALLKKWTWVQRTWKPDLALKVLAHEIGHLIDWLPDETTTRGNAIGHAISAVNRFMKESFGELSNRQLRKELKALTQYWKPFDDTVPGSYRDYRYSAVELYADFGSVLFNAPAKAKALAPTFYQAFFDHLDAKPEVKEHFFQLQELLSGTTADLLESRQQDISTMFEKGEALFRARRLQAVQAKRSLLFRFKYLFVDTNAALLEKRAQVAAKQTIRPNEDPKYLIEELAMVGSKVHADMMQFQPIYEELQKAGIDFSDFGQYLFLKRVAGERSGLANPLGHTAKTSEQQLAFLKERLGEEKFALLEQSVGKMRDWFKQGNAQLFEAGLLTPEQFQAIQANDEYAPFRVLEHWKEWVGAGIIRQTGTLGEVGNPATAMVLKRVAMVRAAERNRITRDIMRWLLSKDPDTTEAKVIHYPEGAMPHVAPREDREAVLWREAGKWRAAHVDPYIAESFRRDRPQDIEAIGTLLGQLTLNQTLFRPLYITYNLGFQSFNLLRDFQRYWKNTPGLTMGKALTSYLKASPHARARVAGTLDPIIEQMEREGALNPTFNSLVSGQTDEDREIEAILEKYGILKGKPSAPRILLPIIRMMDAIQMMGDVIETLPKVAGFMEMEPLPKEERAYNVRNLVGTPNFKRRGRATPITNNLFLFSNIWKEGLRSDYEAAFNDPKTRAGWWWKTAKIGLLPKILMAVASAGLFGAKMKEGMDSATEYDKTNYTVIPIGTDEESGKAIYLRIPMDETTRYLSAIFWKAVVQHDLEEVFTYTAGQIPSAAPLLTILVAWGSLAQGHNPRDSFRGRDILTDDELKAGGVDALLPMLRWTANQTGMVKLDLHDRLQDQTLLERTVSMTPVMNRWVRVTDYGRTEELRSVASPAGQLEAQTRLARRRFEREGLASGRTPQDLATEQGLGGRQRKDALKRMMREQLMGADPIANALRSAYGSTEQQIAIMQKARERYDSPGAFEKAVQTYKQRGLLTRKARSVLVPNQGSGPQFVGPPIERGKR